MKKEFFTNNHAFWLYHGLGLGGFFSVGILTSFIWQHALWFKILANFILWPMLFTAIVLVFRWYYLSWSLYRIGVAKLVALVLLYAAATSLIASGLIVVILLPFFLYEFVSPEQLASGEVSIFHVAYTMSVRASLFGQLLVAAWCFIYIFISENRRVKTAERHNVELSHTLKEAKLSGLANQLSPHFIFNALNNIRFDIYEDPKHADRMLTSLSDILRYSLTQSEINKIPLGKEIAIIEQYIAVAKLQYEDKLDFQLTLPEHTRDYLIPPMTLHVLVENSIKHGFERVREGGVLKITVDTRDDNLWLCVENPVAEQKMAGKEMAGKEMTGEASPQPTLDEKSTKIGQKNLHARLYWLYGDRADMQISELKHRYSVRLRIPIEKAS